MAVENGVKVRFLKGNAAGIAEGTVKSLNKKDAAYNVESGSAEFVDEKNEPKATKIKKEK